VGGNSTITLQLAEQLLGMGWQVGVLTRFQKDFGYSEENARHLREMGCAVRRLDAGARLGALLWLLRFGWGAVFLTIGMGMAGPVLSLGSRFRKRIFYLIQHDEAVTPLRRLGKWGRIFDEIAVITPSSLAPVREWLGPAYEDRVHWLAQFCEIEMGKPADGSRDGSVRAFGFVGSLTASKGISLLLELWRAHADLPPLLIVGDGPLRVEVEAAARDCPGRVVYRGRFAASDRVEALQGFFRDVDTLLVPINKEGDGIPTVIMESLSFGVPVITTPLGGMRAFESMLRPPVGNVVALSDYTEFGERVLAWHRQIVVSEALRAACRAYFHAHFSNEVLRKSWQAVLEK
jgi:glycosyltransferase involved in cell wall biosynthesis